MPPLRSILTNGNGLSLWFSKCGPRDDFGQERLLSNVIERPLLKFQVTDRYHRAFAKLGFHYFLSQFSRFTGREDVSRIFVSSSQRTLMTRRVARAVLSRRERPLSSVQLRTA